MQTKYHIITSHEEVKKLIKACKTTGYCSYDFETNAQPRYNKEFKPTILSISFMPGFGCSIPLDHFETYKYVESGWDWKKELKYFGEKVICNPDITKVAQNAKFDNQILELYGIYYRGVLLDTMLAKYILDENSPHGLKDLVRKYLPEYGNYEKQGAFDKIPWDQKPLEPLCQYGCQDTDYTLRLMIFFEKKLIEKGLYPLYRNMIMTASRVLTAVEKNGLYMDREFNQQLLETYKPKIDDARNTCLELPRVKKFAKAFSQEKVEAYIDSLEEELEQLDENNPADKRKITSRQQKISHIKAGIFTTKKEQDLIRPVNLGSNIDLTQLMFLHPKGFKFPVNKTSDSGKPSTDEETLVALRLTLDDPESAKAIFLDRLLELRGLEKMYKTYILGWSEKVQDDNCLHGRFNIHGCVTGDTLLVGSKEDIRLDTICPKEKGVQNIEDKDLWVLSHEGTWEQITHTINKGYLPTHEITTEDGNTLKCTKDHKLLTPFGMKRVSYIFKKRLPIIMHDVSRLDITQPKQGKSSKEVIFKEVPGWVGYLVSNEGKVYSVKVPGSHILDYNHPHELIPRCWPKGRERVYFRDKHITPKKVAFRVSRLVWTAFKGPIPEGMIIDHIDCNTMNNNLENLQCITPSENTKRAYRLTRKAYTNGSINGMTVTNTQDVGSILLEYSNGSTQSELKSKYNLSQKQISRIINRQAWKYIYLTHIKTMEYKGEQLIYDLSVNNKHSYVTRSNFINSNTSSGRLSSADPNAQQIPKTSVDPNIKQQLVARPGTLYLAADFSQAELRIMAHLSGDETYLKAFASGQDPHLAIACKKYHVDYDEILKIHEDESHPDHKLWSVRRKQAKQLAFGLIYGIGASLLAVKLSDPKAGLIVSKEEAQKQMDEFFEEHPKLKTFKAKQERYLRKNGYLKSLFGRKRRLPEIYSGDREQEAYALRLGLNFPCLLPTSQALCKTKGWVNSDNLQAGDEILAFNSKTGKSEWQPVLEVHTPDYDGDLYKFNSKHCGILSTSYHRWYVSKTEFYKEYRNNGVLENLRVMTSEEIYNSENDCIIPVSAPHNNTNESSMDTSKDSSIVLPDGPLSMEFITSLTQIQLETILYNMGLKGGYKVLYSRNKGQASLIQVMATLVGKTSSMYRHNKGWVIKFSDMDSVHTKSYGRKLVEKVPYKGGVWCTSVPSGAFFVRYIGDDGRYRTMITGNCQSAASDMCLFGSILIFYLMRQGKLPKMDSVCLVHDANYMNTKPEYINIWTIYTMWNIFRNPSTKHYFGFQIKDVDMDMDYEIGRSMAEELPFVPLYDYRKMLQPDFNLEAYMEEAKKYKHISIKDYPKYFAKEMKQYEKDFIKGLY